MRVQQLFGITFGLLLLVATLHSEPLNVVVGNLTFTRPATWRWEETTAKSSAVNRFIIPGSESNNKTDVRFYILHREMDEERRALRNQFPEAKEEEIHEQTVTIGKQKIIYFQVVGTYVYQGKSKRNQFWLGAAIPEGKSYIYAKLQGRPDEAAREVATFKKMVEGAVREHEEETGTH